MLLRERAASTTELATVLETPKGTVGHHLKVLESAGLIRVVRTRQVRALTEKFYGRVARLFVLKGDEALPNEFQGGVLAAMMLRQAADELVAAVREVAGGAVYLSPHIALSLADAFRLKGELPPDPGGLLAPAREGQVRWLDADYAIMNFAPAPSTLKPGSGPPHIRLDRAAEFLIGDRL